MASEERRRFELRQRLDHLLGPEHAATLMEHLHPEPWSQLATRDDVRQAVRALGDQMDARFAQVDERIERVQHQVTAEFLGELNAQTRVLFFGMAGAVFTSASLAFAAVHLG